MREMIYRNLNSLDRRQKDLTLAEIREDQGITTQLDKRYTYCVKSVRLETLPHDALPLEGASDVWQLQSNPGKARQIFVRKRRHATDGTEEFTYKIVGSFYAVRDTDAYLIVYRHILHMCVTDSLSELS